MKPRKCSDCKIYKDDVRRQPCPYIHDIEGRIEMVTICTECHNNRAAEI